MKVHLAKPSFWSESRDPGAWQRSLRRLAALAPVPDPRPCWEKHLVGRFSRRSIPGLYGLRLVPQPATVIGTGFLRHTGEGWVPDEAALSIMDLGPQDYPEALARHLVRRSPWVRLALLGLQMGSWWFPRGLTSLFNRSPLLISRDLEVGGDQLDLRLDPSRILGDQTDPAITAISTRTSAKSLSPLHAPLYLLRVVGWLDGGGRPTLPDDLAASLGQETPAAILRRLTLEMADRAGFVPLSPIVLKLWHELYGAKEPPEPALWQDRIIGTALASGSIEVHTWAPGQPRHGRGLFGERERKLVRWTIHNNFSVPSPEGKNAPPEVAQ